MNILRPILACGILALTMLACGQDRSPEEKNAVTSAQLGTIQIQVTGAEAALPHFERGMLLLHSFEYVDAREAFQRAQEIDADFAMAYWGEAMTHNHSLWREQNFEKARRALNRLAPSAEERQVKCATELERDLMEAVDLLYGAGDKQVRDQAYADKMAKLYHKYPQNHEIASFYALSVLGAVPVGRDEKAYEKAANIAKGILAENPNHPGALHYLIHSYDDPDHAPLALEAANSYATVAPDAAHALHMPSHIYVAMGMWHEVVASNIASWKASVQRMERKGLDNDARSYHALHWLMYGYLQQQNEETALELLADMNRYCAEKPSRGARSYLVRMQGNYLVETDSWEGPALDMAPDSIADLNIAIRSIAVFTAGMAAFQGGDLSGLAHAIDTLEEQRTQTSLIVSEKGLPMCSAAGARRNAPNQLDVDQSKIMELELRALLAWKQEDSEAAESYLREATALESEISYSYGPPEVVKPSWELYGEWLLAMDRPAEALEQFAYARERGPKRQRALRGQLAAARATGDAEKAAEIEAVLKEIAALAKAGDAGAEQLSFR